MTLLNAGSSAGFNIALKREGEKEKKKEKKKLFLRGAQHNLFIPRPNTEALKKSFRYRGAVTWNSLSAEAKQATTLKGGIYGSAHTCQSCR